MDKPRSVGMVIILSIVTLGIYGIWWSGNLQRSLKQRTGEGFGMGGHILSLFLTFGIYALVWQYKAGKRLAKCGAQDRSALYLVLCLVGGVGAIANPILMQLDVNKILEGEGK